MYQSSKIKQCIHKTQCKKMVMRTFAVVLVPLQKERTITENNVINFESLMNLYNEDDLCDKSVSKNLKTLTQNNTEMSESKRVQFLGKYLSMFPFFRRLSETKMMNFYVNKIKILEYKKGDLVCIPPEKQVMVILNGKVVLREHELDNPGDFSIKSIAKSGHILFAPDLDNGNSNQPLVWPVIYSTQAELALIDRETFDHMWKESRNRDMEVFLSQLNLHVFFKSLS